jgi:hypothetical protein
MLQVAKRTGQSVEPERVSGTANRRTRATIARFLPVVQALAGALWQVFSAHSLSKPWGPYRDVIDHPVNPDAFWGGRIRGIGVFDDQGQTLGALRNARSPKWRRNAITFAGIQPRNGLAVFKSRRSECEGHKESVSSGMAVFSQGTFSEASSSP